MSFRNAPRENRGDQPFIADDASDRLMDDMIDEYADLLLRLSKQ